MINDINAYLNPANIINNVPQRIEFMHSLYRDDQIENTTNEIYWYQDNIVKYCFESDSLWNDVIEKYDQYHRIIEISKKLRSTGEIYLNQIFTYDDVNQMLFWYENGNLVFVLTEYKEPNKTIYTQFNKSGKQGLYTILYNSDKKIIEMEQTLYLPGINSASITICKYDNERIIHIQRYNKHTNKNIKDITFFYEDDEIISFDSVSDIYEKYYDFDIYNNWQTKTYSKSGSLQGVTRRRIHY
jgi:hypothetical protein